MFQRIAVIIPLMLMPGFPAAGAPPTQGLLKAPGGFIDIYSGVRDGTLTTDLTQWDDATKKACFGNMPPEYWERYIAAFAKLNEANLAFWNARAELFKIIHPPFRAENWDAPEEQSREKEILSGNYIAAARRMNRDDASTYLHHYTRNGFGQLPNWIKPEDQAAYWNACTEELLFLFDITAEVFRQKTEEQKKLTEEYRQKEEIDEENLHPGLQTPTNFWGSSFSWEYPPLTDEQKEQRAKHGGYALSENLEITFPLTDAQKQRLAKDESLFQAASLEGNFFRFPRLREWEYIKEIRDTEREAWKIEVTPELAKVALAQDDIARWDASFTLHPLVHAIAEQCEGIDTAPLQSSLHFSMGTPIFGMLVSLNPYNSKTLSLAPNLEALIQKEKDIIFLARQLSRTETRGQGDQLVSVPFAKDAVVFLQNKYNPVRSLTLEQYRGVFSGQYKNWQDVGGFDEKITLFIRPENFHNPETAQTLFGLDFDDFKSKALHVITGTVGGVLSDSIALGRMESASAGGIAYSTYHYDRYMSPNTSTRSMAVDGVFPNAETIASGKYPLVYECVLVHRKNPGETVNRFVQWLLSEEGQRLVRSAGYVPIRTME